MDISAGETPMLFGLFVIYGLVFSLPALLGYIILFFLIRNLSPKFKKTILILWAIIGIVVTLGIIGGSFSKIVMVSYALTAIFSGIIFKISKSTSIEEASQPVV
ncbi:MAG: hypothetical protein QM726_05745 [Chitinophagaceae bacterium]